MNVSDAVKFTRVSTARKLTSLLTRDLDQIRAQPKVRQQKVITLPTESDAQRTLSDVKDALNEMGNAIMQVITDDKNQMKVALIFMVALFVIGLPFLVYGVLTGRIEQSGLGAIIEAFVSAPYYRYDTLRKEKNYYEILVPSLKVEVVGCEGKSSPSEIMTCCSKVLDELVKLRESLRNIATQKS